MAKIYTCDNCKKIIKGVHVRYNVGTGDFNGKIDPKDENPSRIKNPVPRGSYQLCSKKCVGEFIWDEKWEKSYAQDTMDDDGDW